LPHLHLVPGATGGDPYGYQERLSDCDSSELVRLFNAEVGNRGWVRARGHFLAALRGALLASGLDCTSVINSGGMNLDRRVRIDGSALVPVD
jgi:hypothetical protein